MRRAQMKRLESKKRKIETYLRLAEENDKEGRGKKRKKTSQETSEGRTREAEVLDVKGKEGTDKPAADSNRDPELAEMRRKMIERQKRSMQRGKIFMKPNFQICNMKETKSMLPDKDLPLLFLADIQYVFLQPIQGNKSSFKPRFCTFLRYNKVEKNLIICVEGMTSKDFLRYRDCFPQLNDQFDIQCLIIAPIFYGRTIEEELYEVSLSREQLYSMMKGKYPDMDEKAFGRLRTSLISRKKKQIIQHQLYTEQIEGEKNKKEEKQEDKTEEKQDERGEARTDLEVVNRLDLLLSVYQMLCEKYPFPVENDHYKDYVFTKDEYANVTSKSPMFAIDCEFVKTTASRSDLAWIAVVDEDHRVIYESHVRPEADVLDYNTRYSGVFKETLEGVTSTIRDVQDKVREILPPDAILCGQSFQLDLQAMKMFHPYVIDTSVIFNLSGSRIRKCSLRQLGLDFLGISIQSPEVFGHNPVEDAVTTMKLVQLKLRKGIDFGDVILYQSPLVPDTTTPSRKRPADLDGEGTSSKSTASKSEETRHSNPGSGRVTEPEHRGPSNVVSVEEREKILSTREIFFKHPGSSITWNLFEVIKEVNKSVLLVCSEEQAAGYKDLASETIGVASGKKRVAAACEKMSQHDVTVVHLHKTLSQETDDEEKKRMCRKLDQRIGKMVKTTTDKTLITVIFSGDGSTSNRFNAMGFVHLVNHDI